MSLLILICIWLIAINKAQKYNQDSAITAVYYSYGAYCNPSEITSWNCKWCIMNPNFTVNAVIVGDDLLSYIGYNTLTSQVVLSFRGTHNIHDWIDDFEYKQVEYNLLSPYVEESYIHDGFYKAWRELSDSGLTNAIIDTFKQHQRSNILVTGHSMGAAPLELKKSPAFRSSSIGSVDVITFGSPRWADMDVISYYNNIIDSNYRITNEHDIVPTVPEQEQGEYQIYYHSVTHICYTDYSTLSYKECGGNGENKSCCYYGDSISAHMNYMNEYESCESQWTSNVWMDNQWLVVIFIPLYMAVILAFIEVTRRFHVLQLLLFGVMPFVLGLRVIEEWDNHRNIWFDIIKMINLIIFTWVIYIIRHLISFHSRACVSFWSIMLYLCIIFNIFDCVLAEFYVSANRSHLFPGNALFGLCLILTVGNAKNMKISDDGHCSLEVRLSAPWILFCTIWEVLFSFNVFCFERIATVPLHLFVPLICVIYTNWNQWLQHKIYALTMVYWIQVAPILKYEIPFWLIPDGQCNVIEDKLIAWKSAFNVVSFFLGTSLVIRDIIEEYKYWHGDKKSHDTSAIQWIMRCCCCKQNEDIDLLISDEEEEEKEELSVIEEETEDPNYNDELEMASLSPL